MDEVAPELLSRLLDQHGPALVLYAQQRCDSPEDVVQEAFVRLMQQRPVPDNVKGWLYRVVRNEAISASRAASRRTRYEREAARNRDLWFSTTCEETIDAATVVAAIESLSTDQREVIALRIWSSFSFEEIADVTETSTSTAHRRYMAGLSSLRKQWSVPCLDQETRGK